MSSHEVGDDTTYVLDAASLAEVRRLLKQHELITTHLGPLPHAFDISAVGTVLDVACGPGGWALEMARSYPQLQVTGVDSSAVMIEYANAQAQTHQVEQVSFRVMDALQPFDLLDQSLWYFLSAWGRKPGNHSPPLKKEEEPIPRG